MLSGICTVRYFDAQSLLVRFLWFRTCQVEFTHLVLPLQVLFPFGKLKTWLLINPLPVPHLWLSVNTSFTGVI